jgi:PAS domain S-box-containing protein
LRSQENILQPAGILGPYLASAANLRAVLDEHAMLSVADPEGRITYVNDRFCAVTQYTREEMVGRDHRLLSSGYHTKEFIRDLWNTITQGRVWKGEIRNRARDGTTFWLDMTIVPLLDSGGRMGQFAAVSTDITARKDAEEELRRSERDFRVLFELNPMPMWVFEIEGRSFLAVNEAATRQYGYTSAEFLRMRIEDLHPQSSRKRLDRAVRQEMAGMEFRGEWVHCRKDGSLVRAEISMHDMDFRARRSRLVIANDVTALRESVQRFEQLTENIRDVFLLYDVGRAEVLYVSPAYERLWGRSRDSRSGDWAGLLDSIHPDDRDRCRNALGKLPALGFGDEEFRIVRPDGSIRWIHGQAFSVRNEEGECYRFAGLAEDISARKQGEEQLRRLGEGQRALAQQLAGEKGRLVEAQAVAKIGSWEVAVGSGTTTWSEELFRILELDPATSIAGYQRYMDRVHPDDRRRADEDYVRTVNLTSIRTNQHRLVMDDGRIKVVEARWRTVFGDRGEPLRTVGTCQDITERKLAEAELLESRLQLRRLVSRLNSVREEEAKRIARELHDDLGQQLTALDMELSNLESAVGRAIPEPPRELRAMHRLVQNTIEGVQRLSGELRMGPLDHLGLAAAIESQVEEFRQRSGLRCTILHLDDTSGLSDPVATAIFRAVQEALTNVIRHAGARRVEVSLRRTEHQVQVEVRDDGRGITESQARDPQAFGLLGMSERMHALGGKVRVVGEPNTGTVVSIEVPLNLEGGWRE